MKIVIFVLIGFGTFASGPLKYSILENIRLYKEKRRFIEYLSDLNRTGDTFNEGFFYLKLIITTLYI